MWSALSPGWQLLALNNADPMLAHRQVRVVLFADNQCLLCLEHCLLCKLRVTTFDLAQVLSRFSVLQTLHSNTSEILERLQCGGAVAARQHARSNGYVVAPLAQFH